MLFKKVLAISAALLLLLTACGETSLETADITEITLSDSRVAVDGENASANPTSAVYVAKDIVYYEDGKDFTYGEGEADDAHTAEEAAAHTVVHISKAGTYRVSGTLARGQIAVDLGKDAKKDEYAVVTLILNGTDITCTVAPAIIFYRVYECGTKDEDTATKDVDTSAAGANLVIADDTENTVNGSYVARIYEPDSVVLDANNTKVEDAEKLHKYDGAVYSKMSMNVSGGKKGTGKLTVNAENEGLDTELHLTLNGGNICINSGNDGINTNVDGISVTTVNGGTLAITVTGETGEGDGIDSNGWLVINGGTVTAAACAKSADSGIDSDKGIHINGGTVLATGSMLDRIEEGGQTYAVFNFAGKQKTGTPLKLKDSDGNAVMDYEVQNDFSVLVYSAPNLKEGSYTLWSGDKQFSGRTGGAAGGFGGAPQGERPERPNGEFPFDRQPQDERPAPPQDGFAFDDRLPQGERPALPEGFGGPQQPTAGNLSSDFVIQKGGNTFSNITLS